MCDLHVRRARHVNFTVQTLVSVQWVRRFAEVSGKQLPDMPSPFPGASADKSSAESYRSCYNESTVAGGKHNTDQLIN